MNSSEKLCLQWNDFKDNVTSSFGELRGDRDLTDVTLACEDGQQLEAHKVILAASSPFFMNILKKNKHNHPLIYMRGLKSEDLLAIIDFLYFGEANVLQENLDSFLALAEELKLKGLTGNDNSGNTQEPTMEGFKPASMKKENVEQRSQATSKLQYQTIANSDAVVALETNSTVANNQDLDHQIKSMMTMTDIKTANGEKYLASCNICGKQTASNNMPSHIEANHIDGISHPCDICGKTSRSRHALATHKHSYHKIMLQD